MSTPESAEHSRIVSSSASGKRALGQSVDWMAVARELGPGFAARAHAHDAEDSFVADNYRALKASRVFSAGVPTELGGGGATHPELCAMLRELGRSCGSTALALAMHTQLVAAAVWRYRQGHLVDALLRRIAGEQLVLVGTSTSDWLASSGKAERTDGGYYVSARKLFSSGSPAGDLLVTSAPYDDPHDGSTVLHFLVPMAVAGATVLDNWSAMGMRAAGCNDVLLDRVFVPDSAISLRRRRGTWHPYFNMLITVATPLVISAHLGVAEAARDLALQQLQHRREDPEAWYLLGELENALATARLAVQGMVDVCADYGFTPDVATVNMVLIRKTISAQALTTAIEKALEAVGPAGLLRSLGLERLLRDIQGVQFHPLPAKAQQCFSGRVAFGLDPVG